jgi:hypothetical protein
MTDPTADEARLDRKKKVRAAHRGSVTRIIGQLYDNLESLDGPNLPKLRQQRVSLSRKLEVLSELDSAMLDLVDEEDLDLEVEQADIIKDKPSLMLT